MAGQGMGERGIKFILAVNLILDFFFSLFLLPRGKCKNFNKIYFFFTSKLLLKAMETIEMQIPQMPN